MTDFNRRTLSVLSVDCLDYVLSFDVPNGVVNLILTGNKPLIKLLLQTTRLSLSWSKSGFIYWRQATSFVNMFSRLQSLSLNSWSPLVLSLGPINPGFFSTNLRRLTLRYNGCAALLRDTHHPRIFPRLLVLEELTVHDESTTETIISLDKIRFSPHLRSLCIQSSGHLDLFPVIRYTWTHLSALPAVLTAIYLHGDLNSDSDLLHWPSKLSSVTDLSKSIAPHQSIDISAIGEGLKRLGFSGGSIVGVKGIDHSASTRSIKHCFPVLETLVTNAYRFDLNCHLPDLPPSLTEMAVDFSTGPILSDAICSTQGGVAQYPLRDSFRLLAPYDWPLDDLRKIYFDRQSSDHGSSWTSYRSRHIEIDYLSCSEVDKLPAALETLQVLTADTSEALGALVTKSLELPHFRTLRLKYVRLLN